MKYILSTLILLATMACQGATLNGVLYDSSTRDIKPNGLVGSFSSLSVTGQITSTIASGTPWLVIASTNVIANLNAQYLGGVTIDHITNGSLGISGTMVHSGSSAIFKIPVSQDGTGTNWVSRDILAGSNITLTTNSSGISIATTSEFTGTSGTMISSGSSAIFQIPVATDSSGTNWVSRDILAGSGVTITTNSSGFTIAASTTGTSGTMIHSGSSAAFKIPISQDSSGTNWVSRDVLAGSNITLTTNSSGISIATTSEFTGTAGTMIHSGSSAAFKIPISQDSTGTNWVSRDILAGSNITLTTNSSGISIATTSEFTGTSGTMISSGSSGIFKIPVATDSSGTNFVSRDILAGSGVTVTTNSSGFTIAATGSGGTVTGTGTAGVITRWASGGAAIEDGYLQEGSNFGTPRTNAVVTWGSTSNLFLSMNTSNFYVAGKAGIQSTAPATELHVGSTSTSDPRGIISGQYTSDILGAQLGFRKARGTESSPTVITTGDLLGSLNFSGYDGSSYLNMASIDVGTFGTIGTSRVPTWMQFSTANNNNPSSKLSRMFLDPYGGVWIGGGAPTNLFTGFDGLAIVNTTSSQPRAFLSYSFVTGASAPVIYYNRRARGTPTSPTAITGNDQMFSQRFEGYDGANWVASAIIDVSVPAGVTVTNSSARIPGYMRFSTFSQSLGSKGRLLIGSEGNVLIESATTLIPSLISTDAALLEVTQVTASSNNVLRLASTAGKLLFTLDGTGTVFDNLGSNITFGVSGISSTTASNITGNGFVNAALGLQVAGAAAKGSGLFGNGTNFMNTPVGTDGWILYADSTKSNGVNWAAAPSGGGGTAGTMIMAGSSATFQIPVSQDATGTNWVSRDILAGSNITITTNSSGITVAGTVSSSTVFNAYGTSTTNDIAFFANSGGHDLLPKTLLAGTGVTFGGSSTSLTINASTGISGIGITVPGDWSVNGLGADTGTNFVLTQNAVTANYGNYGPSSGGAGSPAYRAMVNADIPDGIIHASTKLDATGTPGSTKVLYGDNRWDVVAGSAPTGMVSRLAAFSSTGSLSNVWVSYVNQYLLPDTNNTVNLGSTTNRYASIASVTANLNGQFTSTVASGTPWAVIASTTEIANLNAQKWQGKTLDYLNVGFILGDMSYWNASGNPTRLLPNQLTNIAFLTMSGQGSGGGGYPNLGNAPVWVQPTAGTNIVFTQTGPTNFTINAVSSGVSGSLSIGNFPFANGASSLADGPIERFDSSTAYVYHLLALRKVIHWADLLAPSQVLNADKSFAFIDNTRTATQQVITLPAGVDRFGALTEGLTYTFQVTDTDGIKVIPGTTNTIRIRDGVSADGNSGGYVVSTTVGDSMTLVYANGVWEAIHADCGWVTHPTPGTACATGSGGGGTSGTMIHAGSSAAYKIGVSQDTTGTNWVSKSLLGSGVITVTTNASDITISSSAEANTASNVGAGVGIYKTKSGVDLQLKSLTEGAGIGLTSNTSDVAIAIKPDTAVGVEVVYAATGIDVDTGAVGIVALGVPASVPWTIFTVPAGRTWITTGMDAVVTTGTTGDYNAHQIQVELGIDGTEAAIFDGHTWFDSAKYDGVGSFDVYSSSSSTGRRHVATAGQDVNFFLYDNTFCTDTTSLTVYVRGYYAQ